MGQVYNANTPENHPVIFRTDYDYESAMSILAVCARMFPGMVIYAFQIMSNHIHLVAGGAGKEILEFFSFFVGRLNKYFGGQVDLSGFTLKMFPVSDLSYFRNAVAYVNRNGFVVNNEVTPFTYRWGSSQYFFQPVCVKYDKLVGRTIGITALRTLMHSRDCDAQRGMRIVDGCLSPLDFCHISEAEDTFRDARQYFYCISKNVEAYSEVAKSIGEAIFYTDSDLYAAASKIAKEQYGNGNLKMLPAEAKIELARRLHFDYNAGDKQLRRLLGIDEMVLKAMF